MNKLFIAIGISSFLLVVLIACHPKSTPPVVTIFSKQDSVMQQYLDLQDSLVIAWNNIIHDDNMKVKNLHYVIHELATGKQLNTMVEESYTQRINQLLSIRFTEKTFQHADLVFEYDKQEEKLIEEITTLAQSARFYEQNRMLQNLCGAIFKAEKSKYELRTSYNAIAFQFNQFITTNKELILHADPSANLELKSLFANKEE